MKLGRKQDALADAESAVQADPTFVKGFLRRAAAHEALQQWQEAVHDYEKVRCPCAYNIPEHPTVRALGACAWCGFAPSALTLWRGAAHEALQQWQGAVHEYEKVRCPRACTASCKSHALL